MSIFDELRGHIDMTESQLKAQMQKVLAEVGTLSRLIDDGGTEPPPPPNGNMTMQKWLQLTSNWTYSWPVNKPNATDSPMNLYLTAGNVPTQFLFERNGGIVSKCPANGVTTANSDYCRAEFREMINREWDEASYSLEEPHALILDCSADISHLVTRGRMCMCQFHGGGDDICQVIFDRNEGLIFSHNDGDTIVPIDPDFESNQRCKLELACDDNRIFVIYDGVEKINVPKDASSAYLKFGPYVQTGGRSKHKEPADAYGEMTFYDMQVAS
jgi:hypothetical protein